MPPVGTNDMRVLPNPSNGYFAIQMPEAHAQAYEILDATGKVVRTGRLTGLRTTMDMSSAQQGMYFLRVLENGSVVRFTITR